MSKIRVTSVRSTTDRPKRQKATMKALGIRKMNQTVEVEATAKIIGMVKAVQHLVKVENI